MICNLIMAPKSAIRPAEMKTLVSLLSFCSVDSVESVVKGSEDWETKSLMGTSSV